MKTGAINQKPAYYLNNKVEFVEMLEGKVEMPSTLALIGEGRLIDPKNDFDDAMSLIAYLQENESRKLVIKPIFGAEGRSVALVQYKDGQIQLNDETLTQDEFITYLSTLNNYFISEFIQQGQFSQDLFADSLNTIRILTMIDQTSQKAFIAVSVFRVGTKLSAPTDNFRRHGLSVAIDPMTGQLGEAAMIPTDGKVTWYEVHPDNGVQIKGLVIPHWDKVKEDILTVANFVYQTKQISYVGWDVVLTDEGMSLLEGNRLPGVSLHQVHHPLLEDSQVRKFYQDFDVVR